LSRRGHDWTERFPAVASEAPFLPAQTALLDGEVVYLRPDGTSDFQALQGSTGSPDPKAPLYYVAFDLLHLDGYDLTRVPLVDRKALLRRLLDTAPAEVSRLRYGEHVEGDGREFFARACELGLEGTVSKRPEAPYRPGRTRDWLKVKCVRRQELVVVGWSDPEGSRTGFGSLLLGYHDEEGRLTFAGKVGTGFDEGTLVELHRRLLELERKDPPIATGLEQARRQARGRTLHWVEPRLVAEVAFTEWTRDGVLRHPSFQGLREDRDPRAVGRERPRPEVEAAETKEDGDPAPEHRPASRHRGRAGSPRKVAEVRITNPDRVLWPEAGITKGDLADYVAAVAEAMLPHVAGRPLTLVRCPAGIDEGCFYQKHLAEGVPEALTAVEVEEKQGTTETYVAADGLAGLITLAQLGVLEIHPWGSRVGHLDRPDRLVFDLDPDPGVPWNRVVASAHTLHDLLEGLGLASFARTTGGKGLHVVVPMEPELPWGRAKELTRAIAGLLAEGEPGLYTTNPLKSRRQGKIFVDYLRNAFGATAIAAYATRARPGAPVATPVAWDELTSELDPARFDLRTVPERLRSLGEDPWAELLETRQRLRPEIRDQLA
ncbi:MAG: DNA ligase D, partial [Thermoanaerobaculia bacterium]